MEPFKFVDPVSGRSWTVKAATPEAAQQLFDKHRSKLGVSPKAKIDIAPVQAIETTEQGEAVFPEPPMPELNQPGEPMGEDFMRIGPTEEAKSAFEKATLDEKVRMLSDAIIGPAASGLTLGLGPAAEKRWGRGEWDKALRRGEELTGPIPQMGLEIAGGAANPVLGKLPSVRAKGPGLAGPTKRIGSALAETAGLTASEAALRDESPAAAGIESLIPTLELTSAIEAMLGIGRKGGKSVRQINMSPEAKAREKVTPMVEELYANRPNAAVEPDADLLTQIGDPAVALAKQSQAQAPGEFANMRNRAQQRRAGELERFQDTAKALSGGKALEPPTAQEQRYRERRLGDLPPEWTPVLQAKFPKAPGWVNRGTAKKPEREKVVVPRLFKDELTQDASLYDAWQNASKQGEATANAYALKRGAKAPGELETAWQTIRILDNGSEADQQLADVLKKKLRGMNQDVDRLVGETHSLGMQERAAKEGAAIFKNPGRLDTKTREAFSDPQARKALEESFLAAFLDKVGADGTPVRMTENLRRASIEILGKERTQALERRIDVELRHREVDKPIGDYEGASPGERPSTSKAPGLLRAGGRMLQGAAFGGPIGMIASAGPGIAHLLKNRPDLLDADMSKGLLQVFQMQKPPKVDKNVLEKMGNRLNTPVAVTLTEQERAERRRRNRGEK